MNIKWNQLGGQAGLVVVLVGLVVVFLGWNGAASYNFLPAQFPYLISGGLGGLALVVLGAALIVVDNQRRDRANLEASLAELRRAVEQLAASAATGNGARAGGGDAALVAIGQSSYHRPTCRLLDGRDSLTMVPREQADEQGLSACRVCHPDRDEEPAKRASKRRRSPATSKRS
jgi:hypothetical protein